MAPRVERKLAAILAADVVGLLVPGQGPLGRGRRLDHGSERARPPRHAVVRLATKRSSYSWTENMWTLVNHFPSGWGSSMRIVFPEYFWPLLRSETVHSAT